MGPEQMRLRLEEDGTVTVFTSQMPHGQSHQTTLAQIAADEFGVPFEQVRVVVGDTDVVPMGFGTGGSRSATMAGGASLHGARALRARVLEVAAHLFEASADDMELAGGAVSVRGVPARAMPLAEIAQADSPAGTSAARVRRRPRGHRPPSTAARAGGPAAPTPPSSRWTWRPARCGSTATWWPRTAAP